jgi:PPOX class probable F420-dependent enzyme
MSERAAIRLTGDETHAVIAECTKLQLATINPDGTPHLVTMFYALDEGQIAFWTYRASQKARNIARDPRVTCLVEAGEHYFELRGVQVVGVARTLDGPAAVARIGSLVAARSLDLPADLLGEYVERAAVKRVAYRIDPVRYVTWDHRKLSGAS